MNRPPLFEDEKCHHYPQNQKLPVDSTSSLQHFGKAVKSKKNLSPPGKNVSRMRDWLANVRFIKLDFELRMLGKRGVDTVDFSFGTCMLPILFQDKQTLDGKIWPGFQFIKPSHALSLTPHPGCTKGSIRLCRGELEKGNGKSNPSVISPRGKKIRYVVMKQPT